MKAFGGTVLVPAAPRAHLGYLAATVTRPEITLLSGAFLAVILGALFLVRGTAHGGRRTSPRLLFYGLLGLAVAAGLFKVAYLAGRVEYARPDLVTRDRELAMLDALGRRLAAGDEMDPAVADILRSGPPPLDAWGAPIRIADVEIDGRRAVEVSSAGPDGIPDTPDDIVTAQHVDPEGRLARDAEEPFNRHPAADGRRP